MSIARERGANAWAVLAIFCLGMFMTLLDVTIVNIAIPRLVDDIHASLDQVLWVLNAYSLVYAVLLITSGRLGDVLGPRNLFIVGVAVFTIGSAASGFAHDPTQLILARALQGLGAAIMAPQGIPMIVRLFPPGRSGGAFAVIGALSGLAVLAGPTLGGFIVDHWGWRWIFYLNVPIGALTLALALIAVPDIRTGVRHRLDVPGVLLATAGLLCVVFGLIEGQHYGWGTIRGPISIPLVIGAGVALLLVFLGYQARIQRGEPLLPFRVFRDRTFSLMALVLLGMGFAMLGLFLPLTIYYQSVLGMSPLDAGLTIAPQPLAMMVTSSLCAGLVAKIGGKYPLIGGLLLFAAGTAYIVWAAHVDAGRWTFLPGLIASGVGLGFTWMPIFSLATRDLRPELAGVASGVINTIQELGSVLASAAIGALLQNRLQVAMHDRAVHDAASLPAQVRGPFVAGFDQAAKRGLEIGAGQTGASLPLPPGIPPGVAAQLRDAAHDVFVHAFVTAMRPSLIVPVVVIVAAACLVLLVRHRAPTAEAAPRPVDRAA